MRIVSNFHEVVRRPVYTTEFFSVLLPTVIKPIPIASQHSLATAAPDDVIAVAVCVLALLYAFHGLHDQTPSLAAEAHRPHRMSRGYSSLDLDETNACLLHRSQSHHGRHEVGNDPDLGLGRGRVHHGVGRCWNSDSRHPMIPSRRMMTTCCMPAVERAALRLLPRSSRHHRHRLLPPRRQDRRLLQRTTCCETDLHLHRRWPQMTTGVSLD